MKENKHCEGNADFINTWAEEYIMMHEDKEDIEDMGQKMEDWKIEDGMNTRGKLEFTQNGGI